MALPPLPGFAAAPADDDRALAALSGIAVSTLAARRQAANQPYVAYLAAEPVACGWSASASGQIGELGLTFVLPPGERYLWDFATLPSWRGRGIYPHPLQAILRHDAAKHSRHWIGHDPDNVASARGILKVGFRSVGNVYRLPIERARLGADLLGATLAHSSDDETSAPG